MPKYDHPDLGDVADHAYIKATITAVQSEADTADIEGDGISGAGVPIFYHCEPDSEERSNGAIEGAAGGFAVDDEVYIMCEGSAGSYTPVRIIGFVDGIKACSWEERWDNDFCGNHVWNIIHASGTCQTLPYYAELSGHSVSKHSTDIKIVDEVMNIEVKCWADYDYGASNFDGPEWTTTDDPDGPAPRVGTLKFKIDSVGGSWTGRTGMGVVNMQFFSYPIPEEGLAYEQANIYFYWDFYHFPIPDTYIEPTGEAQEYDLTQQMTAGRVINRFSIFVRCGSDHPDPMGPNSANCHANIDYIEFVPKG